MFFQNLPTSKEKKSIIFYKFQYYLKTTNKDQSSYWKCSKCRATITTINEIVVKINGIKREVKKAKLVMKQRASSTSDSIEKIYDEEQSKLLRQFSDLEVASSLPNLLNIQSGLYKNRNKNYPPLPKSLDDVLLDNTPYSLNKAGDRFLVKDFKDSTGARIIVFASDTQLKILAESKKNNSDGTFDITPLKEYFKQVYIIHAYFEGRMWPCIFALLNGKSEEIYKQLIAIIKDAILELGRRKSLDLEWYPETILTDFELAAINSYAHHFRRAELKGCAFHFSQCIWKHFVSCGYKSFYETDETLRKWFKKVVAMHLIPADKVETAWEKLLDEAELFEHDASKVRFLDYVTTTWIDGPNSFSIPLWNKFGEDKLRTNNHAEGYNNRLNNKIGAKPNLWRFIENIQNEEESQRLRKERHDQNILRERYRNKLDIARDLQIMTNCCEFLSGKIDLSTLIEKQSLLVIEFNEDLKK